MLSLPARAFLVAVVLTQGAVVMMTVEDWDVRFLLPVLPCVFALAGLRLVSLLSHSEEAADATAAG